jgi:hypothetical protein
MRYLPVTGKDCRRFSRRLASAASRHTFMKAMSKRPTRLSQPRGSLSVDPERATWEAGWSTGTTANHAEAGMTVSCLPDCLTRRDAEPGCAAAGGLSALPPAGNG